MIFPSQAVKQAENEGARSTNKKDTKSQQMCLKSHGGIGLK